MAAAVPAAPAAPGAPAGAASAVTPLTPGLDAATAVITDAIGFLRSKGVLGDDDFADAKFAFLLNPALSVQRREYHMKCQERLLRLYTAVKVSHEAHALTPPPSAHVFSDAEFPGYESLLALHEVAMRMQRWQQSRLCYMHAPVIVQYLAIWHTLLRSGATTSQHGVLDVARYIADQFSAKQIEQHVFDDSGGSSARFLKAIIEPGSIIVTTDPSRFKDYLTLYGPGLVSGFEVHADFRNEAVHKHYGSPMGASIGQHAMVLLGVRTDADSGEDRYIVQNWWLHKQFIEMSPSYLEGCGATVYFIKTPQTRVPEEFSKHASMYHWQEMEADMPEGDALEDL